jgi:hypothetical protein
VFEKNQWMAEVTADEAQWDDNSALHMDNKVYLSRDLAKSLNSGPAEGLKLLMKDGSSVTVALDASPSPVQSAWGDDGVRALVLPQNVEEEDIAGFVGEEDEKIFVLDENNRPRFITGAISE